MAEPDVERQAARMYWAKLGKLIANAGFGLTRLLMLLAFLISLAINVLDWVGLLEAWPELTARIPLMTLLLVSIIAAYLLQERRQEHKELREAISDRDLLSFKNLVAEFQSVTEAQSTEFASMLNHKGMELVNAMNGVVVDQQKEQADYYRRLASEIRRAKRWVEDLTWGDVAPTGRRLEEEEAFQDYQQALREVSGPGGKVRVREVYTFPNEGRIDRVERFLSELPVATYWARYYDVNHEFLPPLLQFTVIDRERVILGTHRGATGHTERENYVVIQHPYIAEKFASYFHVIWISANPIRDPSKQNLAALKKVREKLSKKGKRRHGKQGPGEAEPA